MRTGTDLCCSSQNLQTLEQNTGPKRSFTSICWMNKYAGHSNLWSVTTSGVQQNRDSRCHGGAQEVPFHALQVIPYCCKGSFPSEPPFPPLQQAPSPLGAEMGAGLVWEQVLYQEQIPSSFSLQREYNIGGIVFWNDSVSHFSQLCLFVVY